MHHYILRRNNIVIMPRRAGIVPRYTRAFKRFKTSRLRSAQIPRITEQHSFTLTAVQRKDGKIAWQGQGNKPSGWEPDWSHRYNPDEWLWT